MVVFRGVALISSSHRYLRSNSQPSYLKKKIPWCTTKKNKSSPKEIAIFNIKTNRPSEEMEKSQISAQNEQQPSCLKRCFFFLLMNIMVPNPKDSQKGIHLEDSTSSSQRSRDTFPTRLLMTKFPELRRHSTQPTGFPKKVGYPKMHGL